MVASRLALVLFAATAVACGGGASAESTLREPAPLHAPAFTDVTAASGLGAFRHETGARGDEWFPETVGGAAAFTDVDGDGWIDVLVAGGGVWDGAAPSAVRLYRNVGEGRFVDATEAAGLTNLRAYPFGFAVADYDRDGDEDAFVSTLGANLLLRNDGGRYTEVGAAAGLADHAAWSTSALFVDADRDGHLDLYVGNYVDWSPERDIWCTMDGETKAYCTPQAYSGVPSRFYHNNGDGTFSDWTDRAGFADAPGKTLGVAESDINHDGWSDLVVANDTQRDLLYLNDGDGTFTERGVLSGIAFDENGRARAGMGIDVGDVDGDGEPTVFVGHFTNEMVGVYRHLGDGLFVDRAAASQIGRASLPTLTFGLFLFDADLDGRLDLFLANGHIAEEVEQTQEGVGYRQQAQLFMNRGDGRFEAIAPAGDAFARPLVARGAAHADIDRDGDVDVLVLENGGGAYLWRNDTGGRSVRLALDLPGRRGTALGAEATGWIAGQRLVRRLRSGASFLSQSETVLTFGLAGGEALDSLVVRWPDGRVDRLSSVAAGVYRLEHGTGRLVPDQPPARS